MSRSKKGLRWFIQMTAMIVFVAQFLGVVNAAETGTVSEWAIPEIEKANEYGLIPTSLNNVDMTKPITRGEFAELAVKLFENRTGTTAPAASPNPFTDTANTEALKAYQLGITTGTTATTFSPNELMNREQVATMLGRTIRLMAPNADFSISDVPAFLDQADISSWALEHVKYMSKLGVVNGSNGYFMPYAKTAAQQASGYGTTTRQEAVAMSVRIYTNYDAIIASGENTFTLPVTDTTETQDINQFLIGKWSISTPDGTFFYHFKEDYTLEVSKENDQTGGYLKFMYELTDSQLTVFYYATTEFTVTEDGITEPVYSNKQIYQQSIVQMVDDDTLLMDDIQLVRVK